ncbi:MAG: S8 family serine peptidase [Acidaminococcaceae bacterium]|jgi:outer membrane autotransporter protein|nr:S8 family serine peptidase [Acidaminococcaceae bacterium]
MKTGQGYKKLVGRITLSMFLMGAGLGHMTKTEAADAASFKTPEYYKMGALDYIGAADAYALGFSGKGVRTAVVDTDTRIIHVDFKGKDISYGGNYNDNQNWVKIDHGTHVSGIIAANKDDLGMHGVAYNADLWTANMETKYEKKLQETPDIKIINCSFGYESILELQDLTKYGNVSWKGYTKWLDRTELSKEEQEGYYNQRLDWTDLATNHDKLFIVSAGNCGHLSVESTNSGQGFFTPELKNNIIAVGAINVPDAQGGIVNNYHSDFSQMAMFYEDNFISAPGNKIYSSKASSPNNAADVLEMQGTSMAAPVVSGVATLVQEAFPYMSAKQIGDVLLSTAVMPEYNQNDGFYSLRDIENGEKPHGLNIIYYNNKAKPTTTAEWMTVLEDTINLKGDDLIEELKTRKAMDANGNLITDNLFFYNNIPASVVFGQGAVNAAKAVKGPGVLNANRLSSDDIYTLVDGSKQVLYSVDTKGYNSAWSNDISEKQVETVDEDAELQAREAFYRQYGAEAEVHGYTGKLQNIEDYIAIYNKSLEKSPLLNLPVGLVKQGKGILSLNGQNTYTGISQIEEGTLQINGSVASNVVLMGSDTKTAALAGKGIIQGDVYNNGQTVVAGNYVFTNVYDVSPVLDTEGSYIEQTFNSDGGTLAVAFNQDLTKNGYIQANTMNLRDLQLVPANGATPLWGNYDVLYSTKDVDATKNTFADNEVSPYLNIQGKWDEKTGIMTIAKTQNLDDTDGLNDMQKSVLNGVEGVFGNSSIEKQKQLMPLYYKSAQTVTQESSHLAANQRAALLTDSLTSRVTNNAVYDRLNATNSLSGLGAEYYNNKEVDVKVPGFSGKPQIVKTHLQLNPVKDNFWGKMFRGFEHMDGQTGGHGFDNAVTGGMLGYDRMLGATSRLGGFFSYGEVKYNSEGIAGDSKDWRIGLYGSKQNGNWDYQWLASYGQNRYDLDHYEYAFGMKSGSDFKSKLWEAQITAGYLLPSTQNKVWQIKPYATVAYSHINQDGYTETGNNLLAQKIESAGNNNWTAEVGTKFRRRYANGTGWGGSIGYKRVLSGANPGLDGTFLADTSSNVFHISYDNDRNFLTYNLNAFSNIGDRWTIQGDITGIKSSSSHTELYSVMAKYSF